MVAIEDKVALGKDIETIGNEIVKYFNISFAVHSKLTPDVAYCVCRVNLKNLLCYLYYDNCANLIRACCLSRRLRRRVRALMGCYKQLS